MATWHEVMKVSEARELVTKIKDGYLGEGCCFDQYSRLVGAVFPDGHAYHHGPAGTMSSITEISYRDALAFQDKYYTPSNAILVVAGALPPDVLPLIRHYFASLPARESPQLVVAEVRPTEKVLTAKQGEANADSILMGWPSGPGFSQEDATADIVAEILRSQIRNQTSTNILGEPVVGQFSLPVVSMFTIYLQAAPRKTPQRILTMVDRLLEQICGAKARTCDRSEYHNVLYRGTYQGTTVRHPRKRSPPMKIFRWVSVLLPLFVSGCMGQFWRFARPPVVEPEAPQALVPATFDLDNGLRVYVVPDEGSQLVSVNIVVRRGTHPYNIRHREKARFGYGLLISGGTDLHSPVALQTELRELGAEPRLLLTQDGARFNMEVLAQDGERAMAILAAHLRYPRFANPELRRQQIQYQAVARGQDPRAVTMDALKTIVAQGGSNDLWRRYSPDTRPAVLTSSKAAEFVRNNVAPTTTAVVLTGRVTLQQARLWSLKYFGDWQHRARPLVALRRLEALPRQAVIVIPHRSARQVHLAIGRATSSEAPRFIQRIAQMYYGSLAGGRLRGAESLTYGVHTRLQEVAHDSIRSTVTAVAADALGPALSGLDELLGRTDEALWQWAPSHRDAFRLYLTQAENRRFDSVETMASAATGLFCKERDNDYYARQLQEIQTISWDQVNQSIERNANPNLVQIVLVGDPEVIIPVVDSEGLPYVVWDRERPESPGGRRRD